MEVSFRKATHGDAELLRKMASALGSTPPDSATYASTFAAVLQTAGVTVWIARSNAGEVGTFTLAILPTLGTRCRPLAIAENVIVSPEAQREGIGRSMMQHAMAIAREAGCYKLMLSSNFSHEEAHAFYDALGFTRHGYSFSMDLSS